ncbi:hypothetical protein IPM19_00665 [bacterium]|nr:MAG: hypothetical protein IPM19_00665 [bacterium]
MQLSKEYFDLNLEKFFSKFTHLSDEVTHLSDKVTNLSDEVAHLNERYFSLSLDVKQIIQTLDEVNNRDLSDSNAMSSTLMNHEQRLKYLERKAKAHQLSKVR